MVRRLPYRHCEGKARSNLFFFSGLLRRSTPRNDEPLTVYRLPFFIS